MKCTFKNKTIKHYGRCTVCTLECKIKVLYTDNSIYKWICFHPAIKCQKILDNEIFFSVTAKTVCSLNDKYNATIGERIAESRAKIKAYNFCHTLFLKQNKIVKDLTIDTSETACKYYDLLERECAHYGGLLDGIS